MQIGSLSTAVSKTVPKTVSELTLRTKRRFFIGALLAMSLHSPSTFAASDNNAEDLNSDEYYTIEETGNAFAQYIPTEEVSTAAMDEVSWYALAARARTAALSLLRWTLHPEAPKKPENRYNRGSHFGHGWVNDRRDKNCYDTRAKVLIRDSQTPVAFKETNTCIVAKGEWSEPYTGETITTASGDDGIQIDHMVPLKNAYTSGAWEWTFQTRCLYANFLGNDFHLISSSARENMKKGERAPDKYMPPLKSYRCQYLENWLKIKLIWKLKMAPGEVQAIRSHIRENDCDPNQFTLSDRELRQQRKLIYENLKLCPAR